MNKNLTNEQLVGRYFDNEMSEIQRLEFENQLLQDSGLREEYNLQKDLIEGIKEVRRLELKARLDHIPINTPLFQTIGFKSVVVASVTAGIGLGIYYFLDQKNDGPISQVDITENQLILEDLNKVPDIPEAITPIVDDGKKSKQKIQETAPAKEDSKSEDFAEEDFASEEIAVENQINSIEKVKENVESTVEVATVPDKKNKFHYKFFENKLYLLGNFSEMPYEIIELNSKSGKSYFLFYNESFYKLKTDQLKPAPLEKIENDSLVNELKIIQMNQK
jgi:hypothetical protein